MIIKVNKDYLRSQYDSLLIEDAILDIALKGFLAADTDEMPAELFGRLVADLWLDPAKLLASDEPEPTSGYTLDLDVADDRVSLTVLHDGKPVVYGKSYIKEQTETGIMQAISYAAHMCYKFAEQREM